MEHLEKAKAFVAGVDYGAFIQDERTVFAVERAIEIVGEATTHIPVNVRDRFPEIPWQDMADMRNLVIHKYFDVDFRILWDTVAEDIPQILPQLQACLDTLEKK